MCYDSELKHKGIKIVISNCFGVGFDWEDPSLKKAIEERSEAIWEILDWISNGGASTYNEAAEFTEGIFGWNNSYSGILEFLKKMTIGELKTMADNPYLPAKSQKIIELYFSGELEAIALFEKNNRFMEEKATKKKSSGYIYLLLAENGLYKIGKAKNISDRMKPFSVNFPMKWELVHSFMVSNYTEVEKTLHNQFSNSRDVGEWFRLKPDEVEYIKGLKDGSL